ncbi:MAG: bifunctional ADP-dependent NAD(P)H-hydrate dehydratase/NAD(P)H-hydrate epimerase, partial [Clostridia bacterium]|nr:bifunctional ADP-dependent NAD(P)H-hydrate dehydratase/NAD(P)H-hydrate epimerase [Clostridia bacterium]
MVRILEDKDIIKLFRAREKDTHKGSFGTLLIIGGSRCYAGAAILAEAGAAALRIGSGIVRLAIPESLVAPLHARITETTIIA